jgi:hypothetical protein
MTPKARRDQQFARESASRSETETAISEFKAGRRVHRTTELTSLRKTQKSSARCYGCDASGFPLTVWEYHEVASGPAILCAACASAAEQALAARRKKERPRPVSGRR